MTVGIVRYSEPRALTGLAAKTPVLFLPDARAGERFFEFFTANIRNKNTRRAAYYKATARFSECDNQPPSENSAQGSVRMIVSDDTGGNLWPGISLTKTIRRPLNSIFMR
jgi:hypothetical protein